MRTRAWMTLLPLLTLGACATQRVDTRQVDRLSGGELYEKLCSSCHGVQAKGDGPVAALIKGRVPDLTRLALRDGGEFPAPDVLRTIDGRFDRPAHGTRDMPVWGRQLYHGTANDDPAERARVDAVLGKLVDYLRSVQVTE